MAVQLMGHSHPMSLRPYLNEILQRRMTKEGRITTRSAEQIEQSVAEISEQFAAQIFEVSQLAEANQLIIANKKDEAMEVLSGLLKKMQAVGVA